MLFGHGDHFSAGLDLTQVGPVVAQHGPGALGGSHRFDPFGIWRDPAPRPVVLAVNGITYTLSIELAWPPISWWPLMTCAFASWRSAAGSCRSAALPSAPPPSLAGQRDALPAHCRGVGAAQVLRIGSKKPKK